MRLRAALGLVLVLIALDLALGAAIDRLTSDPAPTSLLTAQGVAAGNDATSRAVVDEVTLAAAAATYHPYLGWRVGDFKGLHVNVVDDVRRSYQPAGALSADAVEVYFLGGSAMFGAFQRDEHTIASEVARLAEADGLQLRVANYGQTAYVNRQELLMLESLLAKGRRPDLVVFYDGFNELMSQFAVGPHTEPSHLEAHAVQERIARGAQPPDPSLYRAWTDASALHRLGRSIGLFPEQDESGQALRSPWSGDQRERPVERGRNAVRIHAQGIDLARRLGRSYGFETAFFWQPSIYTKRLLPEEEPLLGALGAEPEAWQAATETVRDRLGPPVVDLGDSLDGLDSPVMYDLVHTNEAGARAIAAAIYERLRPTLTELARQKR